LDDELNRKIQGDTHRFYEIISEYSIPIVYGVIYYGDSHILGAIVDSDCVGGGFISLDCEPYIVLKYDRYDRDINKWIVYLKEKAP
jgi:hypothetical protein